MMTSLSSVRDFYANKNIFITGGTGFLGLALIDKILRDLPNIGYVYLLLRPKKNKTVEERLEEMTKNLVFEKLLENSSPEIFKKLIPIQGDVGEVDLGISSSDRNLLVENVNIVIHSAATLDFQQSLKPTVNINLLGTRRVMELCAEIIKLDALVHISSAYVNSFLLETGEILYPSPEDAQKVIEITDCLTEDALKELEVKLLNKHPNTYTFTKHLGEHEVAKYADKYACSIVRPSMITAAWKEPVPGWTCSKNGPQGFFMGASRGVIRRLPLGPELIYDYIPIDIVVNQVLVSAHYVNTLRIENPNSALSIFHCTSSTYKPFRWQAVTSKINTQMHRFPLVSAVWYPNLQFVESLTHFKVAAIFVHFLPAVLLDFVTKLFGGRPILMKLHRNVWKSLNQLQKFIFTEWKFHNVNTLKLAAAMTDEDRETFNIDIKSLDWELYFEQMVLGVRRYLNNEHPNTLTAARGKDKVLLGLHLLLMSVIAFGIWYTVLSFTGLSNVTSAVITFIICFLLRKL